MFNRILLSLYLAVNFGLIATAQDVELTEPPTAEISIDTFSPQHLEAFFDGAVLTEMAANEIPGLTVSVVKDGALVFSKGYGHADAEASRPVDPARTLFRPGSVSKLFTWTAIMQLYEQGHIDLDADVNIYLDGTGIVIPEAFDAPVTLTHIMTHTPGFDDGAVGFLFANSLADNRPLGEVMAEHQPKRVRAPGTFASYSNWATSLAGLIVGNVSGQPFEDYIEQHIFTPLGMTHSTFREPLPARLEMDMSDGMTREAGLLESRGFEYIANFAPAGGLSSTADDMAKFMIAHLQLGVLDGQRILEEDTARLMHSRIFSHHEAMPGMAYGFYELEINGNRLIAHGGDTIWFHTNLFLYTEDNLGVFISTNAPEGVFARSEITQSFMDAFYPAGALEPLAPDPDFNAKPYAGTYRVNRHSHTSIEKVSVLTAEVTVSGQTSGALMVSYQGETGRYIEIAPDVFRKQDGEERIAFIENERGKITHMALWNAAVIAAYRLNWWETSQTHILLGVLCLLIFFSVIIGSLVNWKKVAAMGSGERIARGTVFAISLCYLLFVLFFAAAIAIADDRIVNGWPGLLVGSLALPVIATVLSLGAIFLGYRVWTEGYWNRIGRLRYTGIVIASLIFLMILNYWNMLGWHLG